jgi:hypothetical protein
MESGSVALINKGYASYWIAEALYKSGKPLESHCFAKRALKIWEKRAPLLSRHPEELIATIMRDFSLAISSKSDFEIEIICKNFVATYSR